MHLKDVDSGRAHYNPLIQLAKAEGKNLISWLLRKWEFLKYIAKAGRFAFRLVILFCIQYHYTYSISTCVKKNSDVIIIMHCCLRLII